MSYVVELYIGQTRMGHTSLKGEPNWFQVFGFVTLGGLNHDSTIDKLDYGIPVYFYEMHEGETEITQDKYGAKLKSIPIDDVLKALETDADRECTKFKIAIDVLRSFKERFPLPLTVMLYAH